MEYEPVGIFANGAPIVAWGPFDLASNIELAADAQRERRVLVRITAGPTQTTVLVDLKFTLYDFGVLEVTSAVARWHSERGLSFAGPQPPPEARGFWLQARTEHQDVDALIEVILTACQQTRRWIGGDPSLPHITKEGPPS